MAVSELIARAPRSGRTSVVPCGEGCGPNLNVSCEARLGLPRSQDRLRRRRASLTPCSDGAPVERPGQRLVEVDQASELGIESVTCASRPWKRDACRGVLELNLERSVEILERSIGASFDVRVAVSHCAGDRVRCSSGERFPAHLDRVHRIRQALQRRGPTARQTWRLRRPAIARTTSTARI